MLIIKAKNTRKGVGLLEKNLGKIRFLFLKILFNLVKNTIQSAGLNWVGGVRGNMSNFYFGLSLIFLYQFVAE